MFHFKTLLNSLGNVLIHQIILDSMLITSHSPFLAYYYFVSGKKKKKIHFAHHVKISVK